MSTNNICFHGEIRKKYHLLLVEKRGAITVTMSIIVCVCCLPI